MSFRFVQKSFTLDDHVPLYDAKPTVSCIQHKKAGWQLDLYIEVDLFKV